ncbi:MAG: sulfite exporter TauE/SafE family protein [Pseudomonadota bacterium]|nr:sulfite exporter TauE/SafE family protein [Pseudomonadota bacterium]
MTLPDIALYFAVAAAGSAINSVAGGGTFIVFPVLIFNGLSALQANIMSTIALWPGSISSAAAYRSQLEIEKRRLAGFMAISTLGSAIGTAVLLLTPEKTFSHLVPWLLLGATLIFTFGRRFPAVFQSRLGEKGKLAAYALQFLIAIYGGYFGAGIGILMLAMLQIMGLEHIHRMNALKAVLGGTINAVAVIIFICSGRVIWSLGAVMIAGAVTGGWLGAKLALRISPRFVRFAISATGGAMTAYFFLHGV